MRSCIINAESCIDVTSFIRVRFDLEPHRNLETVHGLSLEDASLPWGTELRVVRSIGAKAKHAFLTG